MDPLFHGKGDMYIHDMHPLFLLNNTPQATFKGRTVDLRPMFWCPGDGAWEYTFHYNWRQIPYTGSVPPLPSEPTDFWFINVRWMCVTNHPEGENTWCWVAEVCLNWDQNLTEGAGYYRILPGTFGTQTWDNHQTAIFLGSTNYFSPNGTYTMYSQIDRAPTGGGTTWSTAYMHYVLDFEFGDCSGTPITSYTWYEDSTTDNSLMVSGITTETTDKTSRYGTFRPPGIDATLYPDVVGIWENAESTITGNYYYPTLGDFTTTATPTSRGTFQAPITWSGDGFKSYTLDLSSVTYLTGSGYNSDGTTLVYSSGQINDGTSYERQLYQGTSWTDDALSGVPNYKIYEYNWGTYYFSDPGSPFSSRYSYRASPPYSYYGEYWNNIASTGTTFCRLRLPDGTAYSNFRTRTLYRYYSENFEECSQTFERLLLDDGS